MKKREIEKEFKTLLKEYPVVYLTGPRQSGKSTFVQNALPDYKYISLEDSENKKYAISDPKGFLQQYGTKLIIDEAQYAPELFSYIQTIVDKENNTGMFILSGSQNFLLMERITQSLAGRVGILTLLPFSKKELGTDYADLDKYLVTGAYPRIYDKELRPTPYYVNYIKTYVERDIRQLKLVKDLATFQDFIKLCAYQVGSVLNYSSLAQKAGISTKTVREWLSTLEASYILFRLKPYYNNKQKRIVKSPKLYFYDTGLLCHLLGLNNEIKTNRFYGYLFENHIILEFLKSQFNKGNSPRINFWRENEKKEIDLLWEKSADELLSFEIKSGVTMRPEWVKTSLDFCEYTNDKNKPFIIYNGTNKPTIKGVKYLRESEWPEIIVEGKEKYNGIRLY
jgi:predicted AAA+ superfamily ATPase